MVSQRDLIQQNRALFLNALRSGEYSKGPIETDKKGQPLDPNAEGFCAVGLAHALFTDGDKLGSHLSTMKKALGLKAAQFTRIQQEWNDSLLTFPEIADLIEKEMFTNVF